MVLGRKGGGEGDSERGKSREEQWMVLERKGDGEGRAGRNNG